MSPKKKYNLYAIFLAFLISITLIFLTKAIWGAALGTGFLAFLIWNNTLRKKTD